MVISSGDERREREVEDCAQHRALLVAEDVLGPRGFRLPHAAIVARLSLLRCAVLVPGLEAANRVRPLAIVEDYLVE